MPLDNTVKYFVASAEDRSEEDRYFRIGLAAAMIVNVVFAGLRFANEQMGGKATGYWINVVGALGTGHYEHPNHFGDERGKTRR